jgi:hypothetical protein
MRMRLLLEVWIKDGALAFQIWVKIYLPIPLDGATLGYQVFHGGC